MKQKLENIKDLMRAFYTYPVRALPVISRDEKIIDAFFRDDVEKVSAALENIDKPLTELAPTMRRPIDPRYFDDEVLKEGYDEPIPVLDETFTIVDYWNRLILINFLHGHKAVDDLRFQVVVDRLPYPLVIVNTKGTLLYGNRRFKQDVMPEGGLDRFFDLTGGETVRIKNGLSLTIHSDDTGRTYTIRFHSFEKQKYFVVFEPVAAPSAAPADEETTSELHTHIQTLADRLGASQEVDLDRELAQIESHLIHGVLAAHEGNITATARQLGLKRQTLTYKIKKYGLNK